MQRVLIVDDSKTAQIRLKKMLGCYNLAVDTAYSAEEALYYLKDESPVMIFLDHHMEGMDGLEALSIIKANPKTAVIPVIMYTSQQGDVYVSQARALGALDILSKDTMQFSNLERVLEMLNIFPENSSSDASKTVSTDKKTHKTNEKDAQVTPAAAATSSSSALSQEAREQIGQLFEFHISGLREQMHENSYSVVRRMSAEIDRKLIQKEQQEADEKSASTEKTDSAEMVDESVSDTKAFKAGNLKLWAAFAVLGVLALQNYQSRSALERLSSDYRELTEVVSQDQVLLKDLNNQISSFNVQGELIDQGPLIDTLSWAFDVNLQFGFDEEPLSDRQVTQISTLVYRLANADYWGVVELTIHLGNVCLAQGEGGNWVLAEDDALVQDCIFLDDIESQFDIADYLSITFANFEQSASPIASGQIELLVYMDGTSSPRTEYPSRDPEMTAKEWNQIALENNRISVALHEF